MNLSKEERRIVVGMELEKAERIFAEYEVLQKAGFWGTLVNRLYYSAFHAVSALLINDGYEVGTHKGAVIREDGRFYSQLQTMRESADYNCSYEVTEEDVISRIEPVRLFIDKIKQYIAM